MTRRSFSTNACADGDFGAAVAVGMAVTVEPPRRISQDVVPSGTGGRGGLSTIAGIWKLRSTG
jgi:hypothetical protein